MANFMIRIVLHGATAADYAELHKNMEAGGARRTILSSNGEVFDLPDGNYTWDANRTTEGARDEIVRVAALIRPDPSVLVTESLGSAWQLRLAPAQS